VRHGFDKNTSTVTASATMNWGFQQFPSGTDPEGLLKCICDEVIRKSNPHMMLEFGPRLQMSILINPSVVRIIANAGYSQEDVEAYLLEHSRVTRRELDFALEFCDGAGTDRTVQQMIEEENHCVPKEWGNLKPDDTVPVMGHPGLIHTFVCGDPERNKAMGMLSCYVADQTKAVKIPAKMK
ncbi:hypothetical protein ACFLV0_04000, partial [Chloroflexota bacterium]